MLGFQTISTFDPLTYTDWLWPLRRPISVESDYKRACTMASSSKGKEPAPATAKHVDAEGYEMPW
jgi:hypothetical protein